MAVSLTLRGDDFRNYIDNVAAYLLDIAKDVATLVDGRPAVLERFREHLKIYCGMWEQWTRAQKADREKCWTPAVGRPENPLTLFSPMYNNPYDPEKEAKQLPGFYSLLAFLHDQKLPHLPRINDGIVTSQEIIEETFLAPRRYLEGVNPLRSEILCMAEIYVIDECLNWIELDLRDYLEQDSREDKQTVAESEQVNTMLDADLFQHLAQVFETGSLLRWLKSRTWRGLDRALAPSFNEAIRRLEAKGEKESGVLEYEYQNLLHYIRGMQTKNVRGRSDTIFLSNALKHARELAGSFSRLADKAKLHREVKSAETSRQVQPLSIPGLLERLKAFKRASEARDEELVAKAIKCLEQYARSPEDLWAFWDGCKDVYGASANMKNAIDVVKGARKSWGGTGFYPALWSMLATAEIVSELERWQVQEMQLQPTLAQALSSSTPQEEIHPKNCTHSDDFSSVVWYGVPYHFTATQASCVALLWAEWEKDPQAGLGLREKSVGEKISSSNKNYRLAHTFRHKGKQHPAWETMIRTRSDGFFYLAEPTTVKKPAKKQKE